MDVKLSTKTPLSALTTSSVARKQKVTKHKDKSFEKHKGPTRQPASDTMLSFVDKMSPKVNWK